MFGATQTNMRLAKLAPRRASLFANLETMQQKDTMVLDTWEKVLARDQAEFDADQLVHTEAENSHIDVTSLLEDKDSRVSELARMVIQLQGALKQSKNIRPDELMTFNSSDDTLSPRDSTTEDEEEDHMNVKRRRRATFSEGLYGDIKPSNSPFDLIVEGLCSKISKAKWTRDLQEFIYEHAYSILDFEQVFELMHQLRESKGEQSVLNMTSGEIRPCWAVFEDTIADVIGVASWDRLRRSCQTGLGSKLQISIHNLYVLYDYERQVLSMKAICSPQMECELYDELAYAELEE